jgi:DNA-directed RNA polymerase subunit RPC12/RpoP
MSNVIYYCSNCGFEVTDEQSICPSCGAKLENPSESEDKAYTVVLKTFNNYVEAEIGKDILDAEGINSILF